MGLVLGFYEHGNERTCYIKIKRSSKHLSNCQLFKIDLAAWRQVTALLGEPHQSAVGMRDIVTEL